MKEQDEVSQVLAWLASLEFGMLGKVSIVFMRSCP